MKSQLIIFLGLLALLFDLPNRQLARAQESPKDQQKPKDFVKVVRVEAQPLIAVTIARTTAMADARAAGGRRRVLTAPRLP